MNAWAAGEAAHGHAAFYEGAEFWVFVAFVIFVAVIARTAYRIIVVALDNRAERIGNQIDEATRLVQEAEILLASYQRKQQETAGEAADMVVRARNEAQALIDHAARDLELSLKRREQTAIDRIAQAEAAAVSELRGEAVRIALQATTRLLEDLVTGKKADALVDAAIKELPARLKVH